MTEFEEKIKKYLYEANKKYMSVQSKKLSTEFYNDIYTLISLIQENDLDVDVHSILKYSTYELFDADVDKKYEEYIINNYEKCSVTNNKMGDLGVYFDNIYGEGYFKKYKTSMNTYDTVEMCKNFFDFYDKDISKYFNHLLDSRNIFIGGEFGEDGMRGCTYSLCSQNKPFIVVNDFNNILLADILVHEVIHSYIENAINDKSFEDSCQQSANSLDEVYSRFIELVFTHYLQEINFNSNDIDALTLSGDNTLIDFLCNYNYMLKKIPLDTILANNELYYEFMNNEVYSYGGVLAYHYFDEYLNNPEKCKDNIVNLSLDSKKHDRKYMLNNYGLKEENLGKSRVLKKHFKNHFKY